MIPKMGRKNRGALFLVVFGSFLLVTLLVNFFHTEKTIDSKCSCPACRFLTAAVAAGQIDFFSLPQLIFLSTPDSLESPCVKEVFILSLFSRSPPQA